MRKRVFLRSWRRAFVNVRRFYNMYAFTCIALKNLVQKNCLIQWRKDVARKKRKRYSFEHPITQLRKKAFMGFKLAYAKNTHLMNASELTRKR